MYKHWKYFKIMKSHICEIHQQDNWKNDRKHEITDKTQGGRGHWAENFTISKVF